ncbi:hypothetical protein ACHAXR_002620, partial [Thalassiosira sp. AJA248-18]
FCDGGWKIRSSVNAVEKLIEYNRDVRRDSKKKKEKEPPKIATSTFVAPSLIYLARRTNSTAPSAFTSAFWVCPTGTGKSRFMSASVGKIPFSVPRWMVHINLNNFLDQDTFLLCGQHRAVLKREAEGYLQMDNGNAKENKPNNRLPVRIGQFFDATLARVPNRKEALLAWYKQNSNNNILFEPWPSREEVLDRYEQHTKICPDSMGLVKKCDKVKVGSKLVGLAMIFMKMVVKSGVSTMAATTASVMTNQSMIGTTRQILSQSTSVMSSFAHRIIAYLLQGKNFYSILALMALSYSIASRIKKEFFFKFDDELHREDIKFIAKNWVDL